MQCRTCGAETWPSASQCVQCQIDGIAVRAEAFATAKDDVLRAALKDCETHPGDERLCNEDDVCLCDLCAAVDRWQKLEGSR